MSGGGTVVAGWQRLHPLSPVVRVGTRPPAPDRAGRLLDHRERGRVATASARRTSCGWCWWRVGVVFGVIHWLVTRWAFDGATLRIETGLIRRDSQQLPVGRIQAVDLVAPFLARIFGLAELRIRVAGAKSAHHLSYLSLPVATDLRARLLATHHGLDQSVPEPGEHPVAVVPPARLLGSVLVSGRTLGAVVYVAALIAVTTVSTRRGRRFGGVAVDLPGGDRPGDLAPIQRSVPLHRGRGTGRHPGTPWPVQHGVRDHPDPPRAGRPPDRAVVVEAVRLVPARGRSGRGARARPLRVARDGSPRPCSRWARMTPRTICATS